MSGFQPKITQQRNKNTHTHTHPESEVKGFDRTRFTYDREDGTMRRNFKITIINMLRDLMKKMDSMH